MIKFRSCLVLVIACVACGSRFSANEGGGSAGFGGQSSAAGSPDTGDAGDASSGGSDSGGAGGSSNAGGVGASAGDGGAATGGAGGSTPIDQCTKLKQQYQSALEKARACDLGSMDECSPSSIVEPLGCGCAVLVNAQSESTTIAKKARQAYRDAKCSEGSVCPAIACAQPASASCAPGKVTADAFVCTAGTAVAN